jgi:TRAP-type C4-dicarboxylate transport system permease small subunit
MRAVMDRVVNGILALVLGGMTCLVFVSVLLRYVFNSPLAWSEELASLLFAWLTFVGAYVGFRTHSHIRIDTVAIFLPAGARRGIQWLADVAVLAILGIFIWQGVSLTVTTWSLEFPAMEISRGYLYISLPVGACLMVVAIVLSWQRSPRAREEESRSC